MKSKRKAIKNLAQNKVVNIGDYRNLQKGKEALKVALVSESEEAYKELQENLSKGLELELFDGRFSFEQSLKKKDWDLLLLDERALGEEAIQVCEKLKRQMKLEELVIFILSDSKDKKTIRQALEKGCDEWIAKPEDLAGISRLMGHYLDSRI